MKVYLLYVDQEVVGVFSTPEKAQAFAKATGESTHDADAEVYIYSEEVDPVDTAAEPEYLPV